MSSLDVLSREELYCLVNRLKCEINCLKTDLLRFKLLSNRYQKYFDYFNQINDNLGINEEIMNDIKLLNKLNEKLCFVSLNRLEIKSNEINGKSIEYFLYFINFCLFLDLIRNENKHNFKEVFTQTEDKDLSEELSERDGNGMSDDLIDEEVIEENMSEDIECVIECQNILNDEIID